MAIDFSVEPEFQEKLDWIEKLVKEDIEPLDLFLKHSFRSKNRDETRQKRKAIKAYIADLQQQVKDQELWGLHLGPELGGTGLGQVKLSLINEVLGKTMMGPTIFGCQAPDTGNMELLAHNGTEFQKKKYLEPLLRGEIKSAYSMTEPHAGEPGEFKCTAVRDGNDWILNGEKWYTSNGSAANILIVMALTSPEKPLKERASMFIVERTAPGVEIVRNVHSVGKPLSENFNITDSMGGHAYIRYTNVRVPGENLLGKEGSGFVGSQTRLSGGRVHHAMRAVGVCKKALDMACERALSRKAKGQYLGELQMIQADLAESFIQLKQFRLHVLYTAWLIDTTGEYTKEIRQEIAAIKITAAKVNHDIVYRTIHMHGSLGMSNETELGDMWISAPQMGIMDGSTESHKANLAQLMLEGHEPSPDLFPSYHLPRLIEQANDRMEKVIQKFMPGEEAL